MVALLLLILLYENEFEPVYENKDEIQTYFKKIGQICGLVEFTTLEGLQFLHTPENEDSNSNFKILKRIS